MQVKITDKERRKEWMEYFGTDTVPVKNLFPVRAEVCGKEKLVYLMDLEKLSNEQRERMIKYIAEKFEDEIKDEEIYTHESAEAYVREQLDEKGVPILADDCIAFFELRRLI